MVPCRTFIAAGMFPNISSTRFLVTFTTVAASIPFKVQRDSTVAVSKLSHLFCRIDALCFSPTYCLLGRASSFPMITFPMASRESSRILI